VSLLTRSDLLALLGELADELDRDGHHGHLFIVGGAAMALGYDTRRSTRDLDAVFEPKSVVYDAVRTIGRRHDLADDWLNDAVKGFLPGEDPNATTVFERPGLSVRVASAPYLFAMKAIAARDARDAADLVQLYRLSGFPSVDDAIDCVAGYYPPHLLPAKTAFFLHELFD
jgi:Nucleotidyltransferase of unknown function (DUF6036)